METLTVNGLTFRVEVIPDDAMSEPWKEHDGHGIISAWTSRNKRAGEKVLVQDRGQCRYYDVQATLQLARKDGWGIRNPEGKTARQIALAAVEQDFQRMHAWCNGDWYWTGVTVTLLDANGRPVNSHYDSVWGMESDDSEGLEETARELAEQIAGAIGESNQVCIPVRKGQ